MTENSFGLRYRKLDLHIHTPASKCFKDKSVNAGDIINKALAEGLDAIAITDHNTGAWVDLIKEAASNKIHVFPGVEISSTGGSEGIVHIIGIFDGSKTTQDIENLLGDLQITADKYGTEEAFTKESPSLVIDRITAHNGLAILAHANTDKGVMGGMRGNPRTEIILNPNLIAAEATESDFKNEDKKARKTRVCDFLDGNNPDYAKMAVYQASDNPSRDGSGHSIEGIGSNYTYFKLDEISLEGLRQCFCDSDVRIKYKDEFALVNFPSINRMNISQGFFNNKDMCFHAGLNSIVGGKGSGKSLVVEFLRFGLNQISSIPSICKDVDEKLKERLKPFGKILIEVKLENGEKYIITRIYDGSTNSLECINVRTGEKYVGDIKALFPILAYSQNEVIKIAEDENAQLKLIDSFIDSTFYEAEIKRLNEEIIGQDRELAKSIKSYALVESLKRDLDTVNEKLKNINISLQNTLFEEMKSLENKKIALDKHFSFHDQLVAQTETEINNVAEKFKVPIYEEFKDDAHIIKVKEISDNSLKLLTNSLNTVKQEIIQNKNLVSEELNIWLPQYEQKKREYETMLVQSGGDKGQLEVERRKLEERKISLSDDLTKHNSQLEKLKLIRKKREELLKNYENVKKAHYDSRKQKYNDLTAQSSGRLRLSLSFAKNPEKLKNELISLVKGSRIRTEVLEKTSQKLKPVELIEILIDNNFKSLAEKADIDEVNAKRVIDVLNSKEVLEDIYSITHECYPEDVPSIEFKKEDGNYYPLSGLSVGQKCSALLIIAMSQGKRPIIIDQPEDSLDTSSVYEDIVSKLRQGKEKRQFVLTTHNSSVGVASDSDNFIILKSDAIQGYIECVGAIDRLGVKKEIIDHLEGGPAPYNLRNKKYNIKQSKRIVERRTTTP